MRWKYLNFKIITVICVIAALFFWIHQKSNATTGASAVDVSAPQETIPPNIAASSNKPMLMITASKDHTLFSPIYTDYEDIDGDGVIDTGFKPTFKYYGIFDATKCYIYSTTDKRFNPHSMSIIVDRRMTCPSTAKLWSGNFLNWVTMSRLDVVRKMLYGGKRYIDGVPANASSDSITVLERANLAQDSHSFTKTYFGTDIRDYTPFTTKDLTRTNGDNANVYAGITICNRSTQNSANGQPVLRIVPGNYKLWAHTAGTVCQWYSEGGWSWFDTKIPRYFKDADKGNGPFWHEQWMNDAATLAGIEAEIFARVRVCDPKLLGEERCQAYPATATNNYKPIGIFQEFGTQSSANAAIRAEMGVIMGSYNHNLTSGVLRKNIEDFSNEINPDTGVFCHSAAGACPTTGAITYTPGAIKAFDTIKLVARAGTNEDSEEASGNTDYWAPNWHGFPPDELPDGYHPAWGNPMGEMVTLAMSYFAGAAAPVITNPNSTWDEKINMPVAKWKDPFRSDTARDQKFGPAACRPMYVMALSSNALSFDESSQNDFQKLPNREASLKQYVDWVGVNEKITGGEHGWRSVGAVDGNFGDNCTLKNLMNLSDATGVCPESGAYKGTWQIAGTSFSSNTSKIRSIDELKSKNILPSDIGHVADALKVKTISASLQGGIPRIEVPIPNSNPTQYVYITLESLWAAGGELNKTTGRYEGGELLPGGLLSFVAINAGPRYGTFVVSWNDRPFGGDYDMDITGFLRYDIEDAAAGGYQIKITTDVLQATSGMTGTHGYSVMGTDRDGRYLTHTHGHVVNEKLRQAKGNLCANFFFTEADRDTERPGYYAYDYPPRGNPHRCNVSWGTHDVFDADLRYSETFQMKGVSDVLIQDPLWYAAKYGFVKSSTQNADGSYTDLNSQELMAKIANDPTSWDNLKADGSPGSDGVPDGYILARRPELLEAHLRKTLEALSTTSNAAAALSSPALVDGVYKYAVQFDSQNASGKLEAYQLNNQGVFSSSPVWEAGKKLKDRTAPNYGATREIITNDGARGAPFRWNSLSDAWKAQITTASTNRLTAANAQIALNYIRGDQRAEGSLGLRQRVDTLLGPVVNSTPWIQQRPAANWGEQLEGYGTFYENYRQRKPVLWLGANDGMLHAFDASTGDELMAYVPGALANRLAEIPLQRSNMTRLNGESFVSGTEVRPSGSIWPYVDGNPFTADVRVGDSWHTYVFGSLGRGGRGIFALDATDVGQLTESRAAQIFKWQFTAADDIDMGYQVGDVKLHLASNQAGSIARLNNGKFAWILGNGQLSRSGKAALFILYLDGPASDGNWSGRYKKIVVDASAGNGLSTPRWEDLDGNGTADVVYAGDLKGNVWKFDLLSDDPTHWGPAFSGEATALQPAIPLFTAKRTEGDRTWVQPITAAPELAYMSQGGLMVNVGTGNAFKQGDFGAASTRHSVYGIWDRGAPVTAPKLLVRSYTRNSDGTVVTTSDSAMNWGQDTGYNGWRVDLPYNGEAVLTDPIYDAGLFTFVSTRPNSDTLQCNTAPRNSLYMLDPISGRPERSTQGQITVDGVPIMVAAKDIQDPKLRLVSDRRPPPKAACKQGESGCTCSGEHCSKEKPRCSPGQRTVSAQGRGTDAPICYSDAPRLQWREIPGLRTHPD